MFLINRRSGANRSLDLAGLIRSGCDWDHEVVPCGEKEELDGIIDDAVSRGVDVVVAAGGDGTVHEIGKRLIGKPLALGILPTGSGNGFARHLGISMTPANALASCRHARVATIDTVEVNGERFIGVLGLGLDAVIAHRFASSTVRGIRTYFVEGLRAFREFRAEEYEIEANGLKTRHVATVVAVTNTSQYGNDAYVAPLASVEDGLLDVVAVDEVSWLGGAYLMTRIWRRDFHETRGVTSLQTSEVVVRRAAAGPAQLDGEPVMLGAELRVRVVPASLRVLVPEGVAKI